MEGKKIQVQFQLIYRDIRMKGEQFPGPTQKVTFEFRPRTRLLEAYGSTGVKLDGLEFEINPMLVPGSVEDQIRFGGPLAKRPK